MRSQRIEGRVHHPAIWPSTRSAHKMVNTIAKRHQAKTIARFTNQVFQHNCGSYVFDKQRDLLAFGGCNRLGRKSGSINANINVLGAFDSVLPHSWRLTPGRCFPVDLAQFVAWRKFAQMLELPASAVSGNKTLVAVPSCGEQSYCLLDTPL